MRRIAVVLLSGGLDSTTVAAYAGKQGYELKAITIYYGQRHSVEVASAGKVAERLGIELQFVDISFFRQIAWYSALTSPQNFGLPKGRSEGDMTKEIPLSYVPLRNTLFLTVAAALLESEALNLIETEKLAPNELEAAIFIAANSIDYSGYPDCRPEYFGKMAQALFEGSKLGKYYGRPINIETPIILKTKAEIVKLAMELEAPLEYTWSCYEGGEVPCGTCDSCILRAKGFVEAGYEDPLLVRLRREGRLAKGK